MTRNQRRMASKLRAARRETDALNSQLVKKRQEIVKGNLSNGKRPPRTEGGLVSGIYSGSANPVGFTNPLRYKRSAGECRSVVARGSLI